MTKANSSDLKGFLFDSLCLVPTAKSATPEAFLETVSLWLTRWCIAKRKRTNLPSGYCVFVLHPGTGGPTVPATTTLEHFKDDTTPRLANKVCLTDYALNRVAWFDTPCADLSQAVHALKGAGLQDCPFVVFDTQGERLWIFRAGASYTPVGLKLHPSDKHTNVPSCWGDFDTIIARIWLEDMRYPKDHPNLWHDPNKHYPCREPEKSIQGLLHLALRHRFIDLDGNPCGVFIDKEADTNVGRTDLRAVSPDGVCFFAAEIKVAKSFGFTKASDRKPKKRYAAAEFKWVKSGIRQASDYRDLHQAHVAVLLVYDMRFKKPKLSGLAKECKKRSVLCRQYAMYADSSGKATHETKPTVIA